MDQTEFTSMIDEHKSIAKKYNAVSGIVGYIKLALLALTCVCALLSLFAVLRDVRKVEAIAATSFALLALAAVFLYHRRVRDVIHRSDKMIVVNKRHLDELENMLSAYPEDEKGFLYRNYLNARDAATSDIPEKTLRGIPDSAPGVVHSRAPSRASSLIRGQAQTHTRRYGFSRAQETVSYSPQWEQYVADYKQLHETATAMEAQEELPILKKVNAIKFLLM